MAQKFICNGYSITYCDKLSVFDFTTKFVSHAQVSLQSLSILDELAEGSLDAFSLHLVLKSGLGHAIWSQSCHDLTVFGVRAFGLTLYAHL